MFRLVSRAAVLGAALLLSAGLEGCGSDGTPEVKEGVLNAGSAVSGLRFETASQSGVTGHHGRFSYFEGESVSFWLGGTLLGSTSGRSSVTPFDLAGTEPPSPLQPVQGHLGIRSWASDRESPLHQAVNVTVLLQTLDLDGDPGNGVTIASEVVQLFEGASVDFFPPEVINEAERAITIFRRNKAFREALQQANEQGLFEAYRTPTEPASALQALYEQLGLEPPGFVVVREDNTLRTDDVIPLIARSLNTRGSVQRVEQDTDGDGAFDVAMHAEHNERGHLTHVFYDIDGDGANEASESFDRDYTRDGDPTLVETTREGWANAAPRSLVTYVYDPLGAVMRITQDMDGDGELERESTARYDSAGRVVHAASDDGADGVPERAVVRTFAEDGRLLEQVVFFSPPSGTRSTYEYDEAGRLVFLLSADITTGETVREESREYDDEGNLTRLHLNRNPGSFVSSTETFGYNEQGLPAWREVYYGGSNRTNRETWRYDERGNVTRYVEDRSSDGEADRIVESEFLHDGRPTVRATTEHGCVGRDLVTTLERWSYDEEGRQVRYETGFEGAEPYQEETWVYDHSGRLLRREGREQPFGTWTFDYENSVYMQVVTATVPPGVVPCRAEDALFGAASNGTSVLGLEPATWWHVLGSDTGRVGFYEGLPITEESGDSVVGF